MASVRRLKIYAKRALLAIVVIISFIIILGHYVNLRKFVEGFHSVTGTMYHGDHVRYDKDYMIKTEGCAIERIDPFNRKFAKFFWKEKTFSCPQEPVDLLIYQTADGDLQIDAKARQELLKVNKAASMLCFKRNVYRNLTESDDKVAYRVSDKVVEFQNKTILDAEYTQVKCFVNEQQVYHNYFFNLIRKPDVEADCQVKSKEFLGNHSLCNDQNRMSVLVLGIHRLSRANFIRQMPKTFDLLTNNLLGVDMLGYNKIDSNTFIALSPYYTGKSENELTFGCWGGGNRDTFDSCTFVWDLFARAGYRTAFVEDLNRRPFSTACKRACHRQLAHYFGHTVLVPALEHKAIKEKCWRGRPVDARVLDWAENFQSKFANELHFGHFWIGQLSKRNINTVQQVDPYMAKTIQTMLKREVLTNTLLILMSDHGYKCGRYAETESGQQEVNLPFMFLVFPKWFRIRYPNAAITVNKNRHRLVTVYDLHQTLRAVINCEYASSDPLVSEPTHDDGVSFFKTISSNRTCTDARIPAVHCACTYARQGLQNNKSQNVKH